MSCEEVRGYLEGRETPLGSRPGFEEHIASCPECAGFRKDEDRLRASFDLVRKQTPSIPRSLDEKVLASYREHIRALGAAQRPRRPARRLALWTLAWASAAAFALAICYAEIGWFTRAPQAPPTTAPTRAVSQVPATTGETAARPRAAATRARAETTQIKRSAARARERGGPAAQTDGNSGLLPVGFRGLMYCDELSCAGPMDVIRVEMPAEALGVTLRARPGSGPVEADVLVGPDGVARGIRVVQ